MQHLWDHGVPDHVDFTTIGAPEDVVVPANRIAVPGATQTVQSVNAVNEHGAIVTDPNALRAVRAALEHRAPPCVESHHRAAQRGRAGRDLPHRALGRERAVRRRGGEDG